MILNTETQKETPSSCHAAPSSHHKYITDTMVIYTREVKIFTFLHFDEIGAHFFALTLYDMLSTIHDQNIHIKESMGLYIILMYWCELFFIGE